MSPILGIWASQNYPRVTNSYESIATVNVTSSVSSINISSIPNTYKHLQVRYFSRSTANDVVNTLFMQVNGNTGNVYSFHLIQANGSSASASGGSTANIFYATNAGASANSNVFGTGIYDVLDYTDTNKNKTIRIMAGIDNNGSGDIGLFSGLYQSTSAVTSLQFFPNSGNVAVGSQFALYGIKG